MKRTLFLLAASATFIVSCGKDDAPIETNAISGTYDFVGLSASGTTESFQVRNKIEYITIFDYNVISPTGTAVIDAHNMTVKGLSYSIDTTITEKSYEDGVQTSDRNPAYQQSLPAYSGFGTYELIGTDSVFFGQGSAFPGGEPNLTSLVAKGYKLSWASDTLVLRAAIDTAYEGDAAGLHYTHYANLNVELRLKKRN